jgi:catechol 2,3-dioxygenase-like lactoylglutathione lyase family enzyme
MTGERTYPVLPCPDVDEAIAFYGALGLAASFRQVRPYPCAVVGRDDLTIHLAGIDGFDPANSYASVIVTVPDADATYAEWRDGLRRHYGRVPTVGIPRLLRLRRKAGTATGFTVVDVGGNWLRVYRAGATEDEPRREGLARVIDVAARQGDSRGDEVQALTVLDAGLQRHPDAAPEVLAEALDYRAELLRRLGRDAEAVADEARVRRLRTDTGTADPGDEGDVPPTTD